MLKKSNYNLFVDTLENGNKLAFNTMTTVFGIMDLKAEALYKNIEEDDPSAISDPVDKENFENLKKGGYIIPKTINELDNLKISINMRRYNTSSLSFALAPTMNCNMACPYCYEKNSRKNSVMDSNVQEKVVTFAENYICQENHFDVSDYISKIC